MLHCWHIACEGRADMNGTIFDRRRAGLLAPVYALRHDHDFGIGDTISAKEAIDFCADAGFTVFQVLPILETIGDPSPYSPVSSRALSPALLALTPETVPGLSHAMIGRAAPESWLAELRAGDVRHDAVRPLKMQLLLEAHAAFALGAADDLHEDFDAFKERERDWLEPYTLWRLLVHEYAGNFRSTLWRPEHRSPSSAGEWVRNHPACVSLEERRDGYAFIQWVASRQWKDVRRHADEKGVRLIGDLTFGISADSCDVWAEPSLFDTEWSMGTRPLAHFDTSKDAERWGQN
ncbi:MAG: 4-alpha-glucanotransferase, partial [Verrucomicrobiaceae bacterium]